VHPLLRRHVENLAVIDLVAVLPQRHHLRAKLDRVRFPSSTIARRATLLRINRYYPAVFGRFHQVEFRRDANFFATQFQGTGLLEHPFIRKRRSASPGINSTMVIVAFFRIRVGGPESIHRR
jgi:hypothetical protein